MGHEVTVGLVGSILGAVYATQQLRGRWHIRGLGRLVAFAVLVLGIVLGVQLVLEGSAQRMWEIGVTSAGVVTAAVTLSGRREAPVQDCVQVH